MLILFFVAGPNRVPFGAVTIPGYYQHVEDCKKDGERIEKESSDPKSPTPKMHRLVLYLHPKSFMAVRRELFAGSQIDRGPPSC
jgi:hypothetical protein